MQLEWAEYLKRYYIANFPFRFLYLVISWIYKQTFDRTKGEVDEKQRASNL